MLVGMRRRRHRACSAGLVVGLAVLGSAAAPLATAGAARHAIAAATPRIATAASIPASTATSYTGRVLVTLARGRSAHMAAVRAFIARAGVRVAGAQVPQIGLVTVQPPAGVSFATFARRLRAADPAVRFVERERRFSPRLVPNDPALTVPETAPGTPAGTVVEWWPAREDLPRAWDMTTGDGALVGIIDTGLDGTHPELQGKVRQASDFDSNPGEGSATADQLGHGTHVASLACAASGNGIGIAGAGLNCGLIVERVDLSDSSVAQALVDATDRGALAINMSFGTDGSQPASQAEVDAIDYAYRHNVVLAAAAADKPVTEQGDPANVLQPSGTGADITRARGLDVTSADFAGQRSSFAGRGSEVSIAAFGSFADSGGPAGILGAFPANQTTIETGMPGVFPPQPPCTDCRTTFQGEHRYAYLQGTSMATPMVTAVGALMRHLNPFLRASEAIRILKATAQRPAGTGWTQDLGWGILDGGAALDAARRVDHNAPVSRLSAPTRTVSHRIRLTWTGSDPAPPGLIAAGLDHFDVWRSIDGRSFKRIAISRAGSLVVHASPGHRYAFYTLAVDRAGNREVAPSHTAPVRVGRVSGRH
jgi:serine protease